MNFIKTTIIGGLVFLVPVAILGMVLVKVFALMIAIAEPMADFLPIDAVGGIAIANLLAVLIILAICFVAGLAARVGPVAAAIDKAETAILQKLPGYTMLKGLTTTLSPDQANHLKPVLITLNASRQIGLEVDRVNGGQVVVFVPGSPNAWSGGVHLVEDRHIERIDVPMTAVIEHAEQLGRNAESILQGSSLTK